VGQPPRGGLAIAPFRSFIEALSGQHTVVRYDRLGTGLSDRDRPADQLTLDHEVRALEAVIEEVGAERPAMFAVSCAACTAAAYAARHPISALVVAGGYADGTRIAPHQVERLMIAAVQTHWGVGSRMLAGVFLTDAPPEELEQYPRFQRAAATPEMAAELLELVYATDIRDIAATLDVPALVLHRRGDRAVPFDCGRELASLIPGARFVPLEGRTHLPWAGRSGSVIELVLRFLDGDDSAPAAADDRADVLSVRERDVLRLVASGLSDVQIAEALVLSPHTVHRHVANIRTKLRQPTRGAAAAEAARRGLI
jgi:pimeloyl-ACP methyl ester carboxylesterase/DNA-binding CsgD family transcriptional regulator